MIIVFIIIGAWLMTAVLMVWSLSAAARQPNGHSETSSLDSPICEDRRHRGEDSGFGRNAQQEAT
jgi:hypothetical protein